MSVGIIDPRANPTQLNTVEFLWDPSKRTSVFIQVFDRQQCFFIFYFFLNKLNSARFTSAFSALTISLARKVKVVLQLLLPSLFHCL